MKRAKHGAHIARDIPPLKDGAPVANAGGDPGYVRGRKAEGTDVRDFVLK